MKAGFMIAVLVFGLECESDAQTRRETVHHEQVRFALEEAVDSPVPIPDDVLNVLRRESEISTCALGSGSRDAIPSTWFEAARIHLDGPRESDLIVKAKNACLWGPNIGPFWVFRKTPSGHTLVLSTTALGIQVLDSKTNGFRDIKAGAIATLKPTYVMYRFDGHSYQPDQEIGGRLPDPRMGGWATLLTLLLAVRGGLR
jgi:hypothetical protein